MKPANALLLIAILAFLALSFCVDRPPSDLRAQVNPYLSSHQGTRP